MFPAFVASGFAIAGAVMMFGPALIHLLNRNRYRTVQWAAMDFLLEAMQSNRRLLRIRDLLLMLLRAAVLLLFGLALARPFFAAPGAASTAGDSRPPHAILVIDNSLSSTLEAINGSALDQAKEQAQDFVEALPAASKISVVPLAGHASHRLADPFSSRTDAADAIDKIAATHGAGELSHALNQARRLAEETPALAPYVIVFGDQQAAQWQRLARANPPEDQLPVLAIGSESAALDNAWIEQFGLPDGLAELGLPSRLVARVRYSGSTPRDNVAVTLKVRENEVETKFVDFSAGDSTRTIAFDYVFDPMEVDPARTSSIPITLSLAGDALTADDSRSIVVPLVASTPVVFIDQWSEAEESPSLGRVGDTWILRQLLCPQTQTDRKQEHLIRPIHLSQREAEGEALRAALREARLAIVAGLEAPSPAMVDMLYDYVQQGGQLAIAASGRFDPQAWNDVAWRDGHGILPKPLSADPFGQSLEQATDDLSPFRIDSKGLLDHAYFRLADLEETQLIDLYTDPLFFKTVVPQREASTDATVNTTRPPLSEKPWLAWSPPVQSFAAGSQPEDATLPSTDAPATTIAQFDNGVDFVIERSVGQGRIVFFSSGVSPSWSTLPSTNAVLIFDRILRNQLASTFQRYNFDVGELALLPLPPGAGDSSVMLESPDSGLVRSVSLRFVNELIRGVQIDNLDTSGIYWLSDRSSSGTVTDDSDATHRFRVPISAAPTAWESQLTRLDRQSFEQLELPPQFQWKDSAESIVGSGMNFSGQSWWQWLIVLVIVLLIIEMTVAAMPYWLAWLFERGGSGSVPSASS